MKVDALGVPEEVESGLLDAGSPRGTVMWTPLQYASALGDEEVARELLVEKKADPNGVGRTKFAYGPLHVAVRYGHEPVVDLLLAERADGATMPTDTAVGASPLHIAVVQGSMAMVQKLLPLTHHIPTTTNGTTPYELAKRLGYVEMAQVLMNHEQRLRHKQQLGDWLASIGMMEYAPHLHRAGYDDANFLLTNGLSDETLDSFKIEKEGHCMKLKSLYMLKEFLQGQEEQDSDEDEEDDADDVATTSGEEGSEVPLEDESNSSDDEAEDDDEEDDE